jgi:DNA-3-methyladenine glycosylase
MVNSEQRFASGKITTGVMKKLTTGFYQRDNVLLIAKQLLGKLLVTRWNDVETSGRIVEVEAYAGIKDRASHAWDGRRTARNEVMYWPGGVAYVYLCYGIHHLFNVVTHGQDVPHAVLVRALEPVTGIDMMLNRTGKVKQDYTITRGPGNLAKALGLHTDHSGYALVSKELFLAEDGFRFVEKQIETSPRFGVAYAGKDALLPYRFFVKGNPYVSGKPK